jgi:hypothetical protein
MEIETFRDLSFAAKRDILKKSRYVMTIIDNQQYCVHLYSFDRNFLQEVFDNKEQKTTHIIMLAGRDVQLLLNGISITDLDEFL